MTPSDKFTVHTGVAAPILRNNVDTDAIIPSREMKRVSREGLGEGLFAGWRYTLPGGREENPDFVLNQSDYASTSILLAGANFGCGSSREHAAWALKDYGIRAIIAPSFGTIFYNNCIRNGLLPIELSEQEISALATAPGRSPTPAQLTIDLPQQRITDANGKVYEFTISAAAKGMLVEGLDEIALTLQRIEDIDAFEQKDAEQRPWVYL
ncbi:MAG: 3-isopropylmalate dehydratase small subunit [Halieaceae bacterium]